MGKYEGWANVSKADQDVDCNLLQKFVVREEKSGKMVGTVFMDLFERDNKFPGAAHFTVQCGCSRTTLVHHPQSVSVPTGGGLDVKQNSGPSSPNSNSMLIESAQLPIVALVFHFKKPRVHNISSSPASSSSYMRHCLLGLQEVETLHHEWGHALHSLLSGTKFQHLSGTRGGSDFVEVRTVPN